MKLSFSLKNKEASLEADVEGLVEKGFVYKEKSLDKKTRYQIKQEEKRKSKELEQKQMIQGVIMMVCLVVFVLVICAIGSAISWQ